MARWVRTRSDPFAEWHVPGEPPLWAVDRGFSVGACGQTLGESSDLVRVDADAAFGNHCPACVLAAIGSQAVGDQLPLT